MKNLIIASVLALSAPITASAADWNGGYAGVQLGYGWGDASGTSGDGMIGGVHAGFLSDMGTFVVGGEIDYDTADISFGGTDLIDSVARLKLKAGTEMGQTLVYGTVGAAYATANLGGTAYNDTGWLIGIGADTFVSDVVTVGAELLYHDFQEFDTSGVDVTATTLALRVSYHF